jgi:hypothetical protein
MSPYEASRATRRAAVVSSCALVLCVLGCGGASSPTPMAASNSGIGQAGSAPISGSAAPATNGVGAPAPGGRAASAPTTAGAAGTAAAAAGASGARTNPIPSNAAGAAPSAGSAGGAGGGAAGAAANGGAGGQPATPGSPLDEQQTLVPSSAWPCGMPQGIPGPATGEPVFDIDFTVGEVHDLGMTQYGHREQIDVTGGKVHGAKLDAELMGRGLDYQLTLDSGVVELEQLHILRVGSSYVFMRNCGVSPGSASRIRVVVDFEAPSSSSAAWLNMGTFVGTREWDLATKSLHMKVYQVMATASAANAVTIPAPSPGPHPTWDCKKDGGTKAELVYTESVGIAGSVAVGASKRGSRNIIPITGGTTNDKLKGTVLNGGADYQLSSNGQFVLDARYTIKTDDGELIIVRNCGPGGALIPTFETRKDGKYAFLDEGDYLSSDPSVANSAVNLMIYKKR